MNRPGESEHWRWHLASLPDVEPPPTLWPRLQAAHGVRQQRQRHVSGFAAAAGLLLAAAVWLALTARAPAPLAMRAAEAPASTAPLTTVDPGLRRLDDEIALAYARDAGRDELAALWETRSRLLQSLQGPAPAQLVRL